jgi:hypothetical protein
VDILRKNLQESIRIYKIFLFDFFADFHFAPGSIIFFAGDKFIGSYLKLIFFIFFELFQNVYSVP